MRPRPALLWLLLLPLVAGAFASYDAEHLPWLWRSLGLVALLAVVGAVGALSLRTPSVERHVQGSLPVGVTRPVVLRIENRGRRPLRLAVHDVHPDGCEVTGLPRTLDLAAEGGAELTYQLRPLRRGDLAFLGTDLLLRDRLGLFERRVRASAAETVHVFPNFAPVARFALHAVEDAVRELGVRRRRRRGEGRDFDHLRDYREGDTLRQVDWKATSRMRRLITRQFREERDQRVVFLLDCGRRMRAKDGELSHFDHALNSVLLLAYVALRQGDSVAFLASGGLERWMPLVKGRDGMTALLNRLYDLEPTLAPFDPLEAATLLVKRLPRRALVLWITNLRDVDADEIQPALRLLRSKHLVVVASMRESIVERVLERPVEDLDSALVAASAHRYRSDRAHALARIDARGLWLLDVTPEQLPRSVVNRYLEIKRAGAL